MKKDNTVRIGAVLFALVLMMSTLTAGASAASHDAREDVSSDTATLVLGKELTYVNRQYNHVDSVTFRIEKVRGWENANESASESGSAMAAQDIPDPSLSEVNVPLADDGSGKASGKRNVTITFDKAGYYLYRITEDPLEVEGAEADSDTHSYFAVVYVCNRTDGDGNTIDGVYVHDITSYRNESGSSEYIPDLSDIANVTDNGGTAAGENTEELLGKAGRSSSSDPDTLEAYRMWNRVTYPDPVDLVVTNNVTGSLGDITKKFVFTVSIDGAEPGAIYDAGSTGEITGGAYSRGTGSVTADSSGSIELTVLLRDDETFNINDLPKGVTWSVTEGASDHKASYSVDPEVSANIPVKANSADETPITSDGTLRVDTQADFVNQRDIAVMTGVPAETQAVLAALLLISAAAVLAILGKRRMNRNNG